MDTHERPRGLGRREGDERSIGWRSPFQLLRPDELAEAECLADIEPLLTERGVAEGAAQ